MKNVFVVDCARTAVGNFNGTLAGFHPADLAKTVMEPVIERQNITPEDVDEVLLGCVLQGGMGQNVARQAAVKAGIPVEKTAVTINMVCGSGLRSIMMGAQSIKSGDAEVMITGGTENMSMAPYALAPGTDRIQDG